jgi:hypothetical protein
MKAPSLKDGFVQISLDADSKATFDYLDNLTPRMKAFKRQALWAMATDLHQDILDKIPTDKQYDKLRQALKVGELSDNRDPCFAVFLDAKAQDAKKIDGERTLIYIRERKIPVKVKPEVQILIDKGPWTVDTLPFWPSKKDAVTVQRKVGKRILDKVAKMQASQQADVISQLTKLGKRDITNAMKKKTADTKKTKSVTDVVMQMQTLEFGGGSQRPLALWRSSIKNITNRTKTLLTRYKRIDSTLNDIRNKTWDKYPIINQKVTSAIIKDGDQFLKKIGG